MKRHVVARAEEIPPGASAIVQVGARSIGVFNVAGTYHALLNRCPHQGGPLCKGPVVGLLEADAPGRLRYDGSRRLVQCPWHGWEFDVGTGQSYFDPARTRVRPYPVEVETGESVVAGLREGPYVAETFEVAVEDDYVVVTLPG